MRKMKGSPVPFVCFVLVMAGFAYSQTSVNQGSPGNKGPWPVLIAGGADGGIAVTIADTPVQCRGTQVDGGVLLRFVFAPLSFLVPVRSDRIEECFGGDAAGGEIADEAVAPVVVATSAAEEDELSVCFHGIVFVFG